MSISNLPKIIFEIRAWTIWMTALWIFFLSSGLNRKNIQSPLESCKKPETPPKKGIHNFTEESIPHVASIESCVYCVVLSDVLIISWLNHAWHLSEVVWRHHQPTTTNSAGSLGLCFLWQLEIITAIFSRLLIALFCAKYLLPQIPEEEGKKEVSFRACAPCLPHRYHYSRVYDFHWDPRTATEPFYYDGCFSFPREKKRWLVGSHQFSFSWANFPPSETLEA